MKPNKVKVAEPVAAAPKRKRAVVAVPAPVATPVRAAPAKKTKAVAPALVAVPMAVKAKPKPRAAPPTAVAKAGPSLRRRSNKRSEQTIDNILLVTEQIVLESGAHRISILDVCKAAGVSRGTFYRYFASQEELLDAFSRHKRERFHHSLLEATEGHLDPDARFAALVAYLENYLEHGKSRRLLVVAPEYALSFFKRIFHDSIVRFQDVLGIVFDAWDERLGITLDRELICEMLIRYVMSEQLIPGDSDRKGLPRRVGRMVEALVMGAPRRARR